MTARFLILLTFFFINFQISYAQIEDASDTMNIENSDTINTENSSNMLDTSDTEEPDTADMSEEKDSEKPKNFHQILKTKFIEGGAGFMGIVLLTLILGLALCIERILYLHAAGATNNEELLQSIQAALKNGGVEKAKEICRNSSGPIASIFYQGLERSEKGIDAVEKSIVAYGSVQMGLLERGTTWISLFIALAPMLGFMGTVIGMIGAFDAIEAAGDISPSLVAGGIKVALLTTVFGLIVAIILQIFYNYIISKIDDIVNKMEDASIALVDMLSNK
jgi:biopolymer transport protein ExbB